MGTDAVGLVHDINEFIIDFQRFQRAKPDPLYIRFFQEPSQYQRQAGMVRQLSAISAEVDTGQDQFPEPCIHQPLCFPDYRIGLA